MDADGLEERLGCFFLMVGLVSTGIFALLVRNQQLSWQLWCAVPPVLFLYGLYLYGQAQQRKKPPPPVPGLFKRNPQANPSTNTKSKPHS